jgi:hypothetical protein
MLKRGKWRPAILVASYLATQALYQLEKWIASLVLSIELSVALLINVTSCILIINCPKCSGKGLSKSPAAMRVAMILHNCGLILHSNYVQEKLPETDGDLATQPTLSLFKNSIPAS